MLLIVCILIALWLSWSKKKNQNLKGRRRPLEIYQRDEWLVIDAQSSPLPKRIRIFFPSFAAVVGILVILANGGKPGTQMTAAYYTACVVLLFIIARQIPEKKRHANLGPFAVSPDAIRLPNGEIVQRNRVYQYSMRNTVTGSNTVFLTSSSTAQAAHLFFTASNQRLETVSYAVVVEHDGTFSWLAGGLTEELANAVMTEAAKSR